MNSISLAAKWFPSINCSSKEQKRLARKLALLLGMSPKEYRKTLSTLRKKINIVERQMCSGNWSDINYESVPSKAALLYRGAFKRNDSERYNAYVSAVNAGEKTIKATTLTPVEIFQKVYKGQYDDTIEALWKSQIDNVKEDGLVIADVSGSMMSSYGTTVCPLAASIGLATYYADFNKGAFKGYFMTFSSYPELVKLKGTTLQDKYYNMSRANWSMSTDLEAAFKKILERATATKCTQEDMPKVLYIITDMEWDRCTTGTSQTMFERMRDMYSKAGYELPRVVFWNVMARNDQAPVKADENGVTLVSGYSTDVFKYVLAGKDYSPYTFMLEVLNSPRYEAVTV